jgi:hypothetical protein
MRVQFATMGKDPQCNQLRRLFYLAGLLDNVLVRRFASPCGVMDLWC